MKKLIFIRHGRAEDPAPQISDFERSLTLKGKIISRKMALRLKEKDDPPGIIVTSPAFRALETALIFADEFNIKLENIIIYRNLYYKMNFLLFPEILSIINEDIQSIAFFGHNPSFTEIADKLCKNGCDFIPKCGIAGVSFNVIKWSQIKHNSGNLEYFLKPEKTI